MVLGFVWSEKQQLDWFPGNQASSYAKKPLQKLQEDGIEEERRRGKDELAGSEKENGEEERRKAGGVGLKKLRVEEN